MQTPILDFLKEYRDRDFSRLHMPGHKGQARLGCEGLDITEIRGADELYVPEGIIAASEDHAAELFGTGVTAYSVEGSSHAIRSMLILARQLFSRGSGRQKILAARNAHKSFLYGAAICDMDVEWLYPRPEAENSVAACGVEPGELASALEEQSGRGVLPFAVYVTSPDYLGRQADIRGLAVVAHKYGLPLLVDNAHGAYLHFLPQPCHPMDLGADFCCDSAHKTLPVLTGGAYLHVRKGLTDRRTVKAAMEVTGTTSPSYLIMASLDLCNQELADYPQKLAELIRKLDRWKDGLIQNGIPVLANEPLKLVVHASTMGFTGEELGDVLRKHRVEPEFCDADYLVGMLTLDTRDVDLERTGRALLEAKQLGRPARHSQPLRLRPLEQVMTIREAVLAHHEAVPAEESVGRICGSPTVSCPPAIPIAVSGERIGEELLPIFKAYHIDWVTVVK